MTTSAITIISYTAESDAICIPDGVHIVSRNRRIWQYFCNGQVLKSRYKAIQRVQKEMERLNHHKGDSDDPEAKYPGLMLYFDYRLNDVGKKKVYRFFLLDGYAVSKTELLERIEQEKMFLADAGVDFKQVDDGDGKERVFGVAEDGMV